MLGVLLLVLSGCGALGLPTLEDNKIPTDEEILGQLGQPEEISPLNLPTDEESFNQLNVMLSSGTPSSGSGTYHFVSSTFPEVDARGFHESVFDGIGDYFPSWSVNYKRDDSRPPPTLAQRLGLQPYNHHSYRKRSESSRDTFWLPQPSIIRRKREMPKSSLTFKYHNNTFQHSHTPLKGKEFIKSLTEDHLKGLYDFSGNTNRNYSENQYYSHSRTTKREVNSDFDYIPSDVVDKSQSSREENTENPRTEKRSSARYIRGMEMGSSGFHGDIFNRDFGDFTTMKKRKRARGSSGFHSDTFSDGFGDFQTMKRSDYNENILENLGIYLNKIGNDNNERENEISSEKRNQEMDSTGGGFETLKKRRPEMDSMGFHGDTFSRGFGDFETLKKRRPEMDSMGFHGDTFSRGFGDFETLKKRRPEMDSMGFHGDTFSRGFGEFETFKKRRPEMDSMGFHGDTFSRGFGDFETLKKRRPEMDSMGFHGDTFSRGFGDFETLKKRKPEMDSMGFHGDTFSRGFGDFETLKKRRPEMDSMGFHGDTFSRGFGEFETFKKRRPEMDSMGFHGDTFSRGFGDFETLKKRRPEVDAMGFNGDTFNRGFGDFYTKKRKVFLVGNRVDCVDSRCQRHLQTSH